MSLTYMYVISVVLYTLICLGIYGIWGAILYIHYLESI